MFDVTPGCCALGEWTRHNNARFVLYGGTIARVACLIALHRHPNGTLHLTREGSVTDECITIGVSSNVDTMPDREGPCGNVKNAEAHQRKRAMRDAHSRAFYEKNKEHDV